MLCFGLLLMGSASAQFGGSGYPGLRSGIDPGAPADVAIGKELSLTANTANLESPGTMRLKFDKALNAQKALTHDAFRSHIENVVEDGSAAVWGVEFAQAGNATVSAYLKIDKDCESKTVMVQLIRVTPNNIRSEASSASLKTRATNGQFANQETVSIHVPEAGFYEVKLAAKKQAPPVVENGAKIRPIHERFRIGEIQKLDLHGEAVEGARVMTIRSPRTGAVHGNYQSSKSPADIILAVMEVRIATPDQTGQYFPITTPFGYFGSTWMNDTGRFGGANFSLWSESDAARAADIPRLSHLLAYRADAVYTVYGHEGIGVKPIGENPWLKMKPTHHEILAIRKEPGETLDTYTCYFANLDTGKWELFGSGKNFNKSGKLTGLNVGSFVEVLYPSPQIRRESNVRGWYMNKKGEWFQIDQMQVGKYEAAKDVSHREHGVTEDGWFKMATGGWYPNDLERRTIELPPRFRLGPDDRPKFLKGSQLQSLLTLPIGIETSNVVATKNSATVKFTISRGELDGTGCLYYGFEDKSTFPHDIEDRDYPFVKQWKWEHLLKLNRVKLGTNTTKIQGLTSGKRYYYRILIHGKDYHVWSPETEVFTTKQ